jgi:hypothetical protein
MYCEAPHFDNCGDGGKKLHEITRNSTEFCERMGYHVGSHRNCWDGVPAATKKQLARGRSDPWKKNMAIVEFDYIEVLARILNRKALQIFAAIVGVLGVFFGVLYYINSWQLGLIDETRAEAQQRKIQMKEMERKRKERIKKQRKVIQQINFEIEMESKN